VNAVYQRGVLQPEAGLDLPEGARVRVVVLPKGAVYPLWGGGRRLGLGFVQRLVRAVSWGWVLFALALGVYGFTRLYALESYPIYFFADEASQTLFAETLIENGFRDAGGSWLPLYFNAAANRWTPLLSVYFQALGMLLFGKSIVVTRGITAGISILGAATVGLALKWVFRARLWWAGVLLLAITPAWFLHSRTGFETVLMTTFFACFLLAYLLYRTRSPRFVYAVLVFGAATFYAYSNAQVVMAAAGLLLLLFDWRYHLQNRRVLLRALPLALLLALPLLRFRLQHPEAMQTHLRMVDSYWFHDISLGEKGLIFLRKYLHGLDPRYWFFPHGEDLPRHRMKIYGHIRLEVLPLVLIGLGISLKNWRSAAHRTVLLAALATPAGAALLEVGIARVLAFVIPAALLAAIGLEGLLSWLQRLVEKRFPLPRGLLPALVFSLLSVASLSMLRTALVEGPLWFSDYGLYGMQYGAKQLFVDTIPRYLARDPAVRLEVSPTWANGTDVFKRFFLPESEWPRVNFRTIDTFLFERMPLDEHTYLIMTPAELEKAQASEKLQSVQVVESLAYPDGSPGFYITQIAYVDNVDEIFAAEKEARRQLVEETFELDGQRVTIRHSMLDMGQLKDVFDGDTFTLMRGLEANPFIVEIEFPQPREVRGLAADFATMDFSLTVELFPAGEGESLVVSETYRGLPPDPHVELDFPDPPLRVEKLRLEVLHLGAGEEAKIHIRELSLK
jgi:hypothetical protein